MSPAFRSWLPASAALPPLAKGAFAAMVDGWASAWFAGEQPRALGLFERVADVRGELRKIVWHCCDGGLAIGVSTTGTATMGAAMLGVTTGGVQRTEADEALFERVGTDCLNDLKQRTAALLGPGKAAIWREHERGNPADPVHRIEIAGSNRAFVLTLDLSPDCFARFAKAQLPVVARPIMGEGEAALAALPVTLSVAVGGCSVTVAELSSLAQGDVLVLDRALDAPLPLAVGGVTARRGACTLSQRGDRIALKITEALAG